MVPPTENKTRRRLGPRLALIGILLAAVAGGFGVLHYFFTRPTTNDAHLLFKGQVIASMAPAAAEKIQEGMRATVTIDGFDDQTFSGSVQVVERDSAKETLLIIQLKNPPEDATPRAACAVTVDTSILPSLLLK